LSSSGGEAASQETSTSRRAKRKAGGKVWQEKIRKPLSGKKSRQEDVRGRRRKGVRIGGESNSKALHWGGRKKRVTDKLKT